MLKYCRYAHRSDIFVATLLPDLAASMHVTRTSEEGDTQTSQLTTTMSSDCTNHIL